mgnify:CR=1 FL=1
MDITTIISLVVSAVAVIIAIACDICIAVCIQRRKDPQKLSGADTSQSFLYLAESKQSSFALDSWGQS